MIEKDNVIYAGLTTEKGIELFNSIPSLKTGYTFKRITDGENVGNKIELTNQKEKGLYVETEEDEVVQYFVKKGYYQKDNAIYAGVLNENGYQLYISSKNPWTGKKFIRIHDGYEFGSEIHLGLDWSYYKEEKTYRVDKPEYYLIVDDEPFDETEEEEKNG
jgi:hypothetical protein